MKYRVSYYRNTEVVSGRAPRYMLDIEAESTEEAIATIEPEHKEIIVVRSVYKAPNNPIRSNPSFVFLNSEDRNRWYSSKSTQKERFCRACQKNKVARYKRLCGDCENEKSVKHCAECQKSMPLSCRRNYCDECSEKRKKTQSKVHRERRAKQGTIERIQGQIAWAHTTLKTTTLSRCSLASRYQGLRQPNLTINLCRHCLQRFIDVQTVYLANLMTEKQTTSFIDGHFSEVTHVNSHAASA